MKQPILFYNSQKFTDLKPIYDTLHILSKRIIIKDKQLDIEIDFKDKINQFNKIIIDGIVFVKETKQGACVIRKAGL